MIGIQQEKVGRWSVLSAVFEREMRRIRIPVLGIVGNAVPTSPSGKANLLAWKRAVAVAAKLARDGVGLVSRETFAVSAGFAFHPHTHGNQPLDIENFLKPTFDGLAAGLFCEDTVDCRELLRFGYDDSGFRFLFVHRLPDSSVPAEEGVGIVVSISA